MILVLVMAKVKTYLWSWPGMKEIPLPEPFKCPRCGESLPWHIVDDQFHYETGHHHVYESLPNMRSHGFYFRIPRYE